MHFTQALVRRAVDVALIPSGFVLGLLVALVFCPTGANAATISFADTYGPLAVPFPESPLATLSHAATPLAPASARSWVISAPMTAE